MYGKNKRVREGPLPPADSATSVRDDILRGVFGWAHNDTRPGLPAPATRTDIIRTRPDLPLKNPTPGSLTGVPTIPYSISGAPEPKQVNPENPTGGSLTRNPPLPYARPGNSTTATLGFKKNSPSGTGLPDQPLPPQRPTAAPGQTTGGPGTNQNPRPSFDYAKLGQSTTITPGFGKTAPSGRGLLDQQKEFTLIDPAALRRLRNLRPH
jgi:hypothetical protein